MINTNRTGTPISTAVFLIIAITQLSCSGRNFVTSGHATILFRVAQYVVSTKSYLISIRGVRSAARCDALGAAPFAGKRWDDSLQVNCGAMPKALTITLFCLFVATTS